MGVTLSNIFDKTPYSLNTPLRFCSKTGVHTTMHQMSLDKSLMGNNQFSGNNGQGNKTGQELFKIIKLVGISDLIRLVHRRLIQGRGFF